jgi:hypothetical protein
MWTILKFEKKNLSFLKKFFRNQLGDKVEFYTPKIRLQKNINTKFRSSEFFLLGNYMMCFHKEFQDSNKLKMLKNCRGLKYFLNNYFKSQDDIISFINRCKLNEDNEGFIKQTFFEFKKSDKFEFLSGPFTSMFFNIIRENTLSMDILVGKYKTTVSKEKNFLFRAV